MSLAARKIRLIMMLRQSGVTDTAVLAAIERIPRESFVPQPFLDQAYENRTLPIGHGQTLSQPEVVAVMTQALGLKSRHKVLEIGTGSGYQTALLAELCFNVFSVEKLRGLSRRARRLLDQLGYQNIALHVGDGTIGWSDHAPYDAILVAAAAPAPPKPLLEQLAPGGRLVLPVGDDQVQILLRITRGAGGFEEQQLGECKFVKLLGKYGWPE